MSKQNIGGLGRGLGSLIPSKKENEESKQPSKDYFSAPTFASRSIEDSAKLQITEIPVEIIFSNKYQPRKYFAQKDLEELAASIKEHGILQPLVVVEKDEGRGYELVAGERRLRASKIAGLKVVPAIVRDYGELERLELALIENIQRSDLNPIEEASAYQKLNDNFGLTHDQIAKRMGKSRPVISNAIRLLGLPDEIQKALAEGKITEGHAKILMELKDDEKRLALFKRVLSEKLTITDTTHEVKKVEVKRHARKVTRDPNVAAYEDRLRSSLGTRVSIKRKGKHAGVIVIEYYGEEEFNGLIDKLS